MDDVKGGSTEVIDIGPYLPAIVKRDVTRMNGTLFRILFETGKYS